jgi:hypothetical protein
LIPPRKTTDNELSETELRKSQPNLFLRSRAASQRYPSIDDVRTSFLQSWRPNAKNLNTEGRLLW